jgi:transglutaminase-like putative cysteine protease
VSPDADNSVGQFGAIPGLAGDIPSTEITTAVDVRNIFGRWLPTPYPTRSIDGLVGRWLWEPNALAVRSSNSSIRGQKYDITSLELRPTVEQLRAAPEPDESIISRDTALVDGLPQSVIDEALAITAASTTDYDRAMALQNYFRSGEFTYSEDAPVEGDYDGTGISVLAPFLTEKSGYCVHFSSAMAVMARVVGIPSRVAVGFLPGDPSTNLTTDVTTHTVTSHDLHAWPELYFEGVGWMRFEPTPGRGAVPNYEATIPDDPATPSVDESAPSVAPTAAAPTVAPDIPVDVQPDAAPTSSGSTAVPALRIVGFAALALLIVFAPALVRVALRRRRLRASRTLGSALPAWREIRATATDLGLDLDDADTPREAAARLPQSLGLGRVIGALEGESFARGGVPVGGASTLDALNAVDAADPVNAVDAADVRAVLAAMEGSVPLTVRLRARLFAPSLWPRRDQRD